MRLDKYLASFDVGSRAQVKKIIQKSRVTVNDTIVTSPEYKLSETDIVCVDGKVIAGEEFYYYMFHKPAGCVSACKDDDFETVIDYFKEVPKCRELFPVGRLDKDTEGLLIITNDGNYSHTLTSPKKKIAKTYYFETDVPMNSDAKMRMEEGITLKDGTECSPAVLSMETEKKGTLTIYEGAYHQVKRMVAACCGHITYLKRISIGDLKLDETLSCGSFRLLTKEETCQAICQSAKKI